MTAGMTGLGLADVGTFLTLHSTGQDVGPERCVTGQELHMGTWLTPFSQHQTTSSGSVSMGNYRPDSLSFISEQILVIKADYAL